MKNFKIITLITCLVLVFTACRKDDNLALPTTSKLANMYSGEKVNGYFNLLCKISQSTLGIFPPQAARAYGYIGIANYEAVVNGIPGAQSLAGQINGLSISDLPKIEINKNYNWSIASNVVLADMIRKMFAINITATNSRKVDSMETANLNELSGGENTETINRSIQFGKDITTAIYNYSKTDAGHQSYLDPFQLPYNMQADSFCWVPTGAITNPISPKWGNNRPFLTANVTNTQPAPPVPFSTVINSAFYQEAISVYN